MFLPALLLEANWWGLQCYTTIVQAPSVMASHFPFAADGPSWYLLLPSNYLGALSEGRGQVQ